MGVSLILLLTVFIQLTLASELSVIYPSGLATAAAQDSDISPYWTTGIRFNPADFHLTPYGVKYEAPVVYGTSETSANGCISIPTHSYSAFMIITENTYDCELTRVSEKAH